MKVIIAATILFFGLGFEKSSGQSARNVIQFSSMISHVTGRSAFDYLEYGCYCGLGGSGTPIDEIDRCCQVHDSCYAAVYGVGLAHVTTYSWTKVAGGYVTCDNDFGSVQRDACECDREASYCFRRYPYPGRQPC